MPDITISRAAVDESFFNSLTFVVTLSEPSPDAVTVQYRTLLNGTADENDINNSSTHTNNNGTVTFAPGETTANILIVSGSDSIDEVDESIVVELFNPDGADFADGLPVLRTTGVIRDDDGLGSNLALFVSDPVITEGDAGQKLAVFEVLLSRPAPSGFTVNYQTSDLTATAGSDYQAMAGTINFGAGQTVATVAVPVFGDLAAEATEKFALEVTVPGAPAIDDTRSVGEATILDTDTSALPEISISRSATDEHFFHSLRFTVTLSEPSADAVTVNYRTLLNGTANENDINNSSTHTNNNGTVTFAPGETSADIFIVSNSDAFDETDEAIVVELFDPDGAVLEDGLPVLRTTGVIRDDDGAGSNLSIFVSDPVITEGDAGQKLAVFEVLLSRPAPSGFTLNYQTSDLTATAGSDYQAMAGTIDFVTGQTLATVAVPVFGDLDAEAAESFALEVTVPGVPAIDDTRSVGEATILDTDTSALPEISVSRSATDEHFFHYLRFTVTLSEPSADAVTVHYRTLLNGTANENDIANSSTHISNNGTVTFAPGETSVDIFINSNSDAFDETDEAIVVELFDPDGAVLEDGLPVLRTTGVVRDDDGAGSNLSIFVSDPVITEGDAGQKLAVFEVLLSRPAPSGFTVNYQTSDLTATAGSDYQAMVGTIDFVTGQTVATVAVPVFGDLDAEAAEKFALEVTVPGVPAIDAAGSVGEATILDTDTSVLPEISVSRSATDEHFFHYLRFTVTLSEPSADAVTVHYRTLLNGTANENDIGNSSTHINNNGTVTFAPGETSVDIFINSNSDAFDETDEAIVVELFDPEGAVLEDGLPVLRTTGVIWDDDGVGSNLAIFVSDPVITEGDAGQKLAVFEVLLSRPAPSDFTVNYQTSDLTATAGSDYQAMAGTIDFVTGQTVATVAVPVFGDLDAKAAEKFALEVTVPGVPAIDATGSVGEATILDTDTSVLPEISISRAATDEHFFHYLRFTVTLSEPSVDVVTADYRTQLDGTAVDADIGNAAAHPSNNGTVTFAPGETSVDIFINSNSDAVDERDESLMVELFNPTNAVLDGGVDVLTGVGFIFDDDGVGFNNAVIVRPDTLFELSGGANDQVLLVQLSRPAESALSFVPAVSSLSATSGVDFQLLDATVDFVEGQQVAALRVRVFSDNTVEGDETFGISLNPAAGTAFPGTIPTVEVTISELFRIDDLVINGGAVSENAANPEAVATFQAIGASAPGAVNFSLVNNAGGRFVLDGNTLRVAPGANLDFESATSHVVRIAASEGGGPVYQEDFVIQINNMPISDIELVSGGTVIEGTAADTVIATFESSENPVEPTAVLSIVSGADGLFYLDGNDLKVSPGATFDFDDQSNYFITFSATDGTGPAYEESFDIFVQKAGPILGTPDEDILNGTLLDDEIQALESDDIINASFGDDDIDGGPGTDTVVYARGRNQITHDWMNDGTIVVSRTALGEGTDTLTNVERIDLDDGSLLYDVDTPNLGFGYRIYQASFDRTPDEGGVLFWIGVLDDLDNQGWSQYDKEQFLASQFIQSDEFKDLFGANPTNEEYIDAMYQNVLDRLPDQGGYDFWVGGMVNDGLTREDILIAFTKSDENVDRTAPDLDDGVWVV